MALTAAVIRELMAAGLEGDALADACERIELLSPQLSASDLQAERRRAADRERKRLKRLRNSAESADNADIAKKALSPQTPLSKEKPQPKEKPPYGGQKENPSPLLDDNPHGAEPDPPPKPKPKRSTSINESWQPDERDVAHAVSKKFTTDEIKDMADGFRDYHLSRGTTLKDWNAGWRTWVGNARKFGSRRPSGKNGASRGGQEDPLVLAAMRNASARQSSP